MIGYPPFWSVISPSLVIEVVATDLTGSRTANTAETIRWLRRNRLLGVSSLLVQRGRISDEVETLAGAVAQRHGRQTVGQLAEEARVFSALVEAGVATLALKGCRLAYSVYADPSQRLRVDIDLLVSPDCLSAAREVLKEIGYRPLYSTPGGTPIPQETWIRDAEPGRHMIDLHWKLRTHPCLRDRLNFEEQWQSRVALPGLAEGAYGQSAPHALLNASMHWFDNLYGKEYPLVWILDKDLLWRAMDDNERDLTLNLARDRGLAGLLAESLRLAHHHFGTPVEQETIAMLDAAGKGRRPTRLIALQRRRFRSWLFALRCEPGWRGRWHRLRESLLPPAAHLRERYPEGSRFGVLGLWGRRVRERLMG